MRIEQVNVQRIHRERVDVLMRQTGDGRETGRTQISQDEEEEPNT